MIVPLEATYLESSINASMEDYEAREFSPTVPDLPSQHSGFRSNNGSEYSVGSSRRSYSPPAWRKAGSGWFKHQSLSPSRRGFRSKESSPQYHDAEEEGDGDVTAYRIATKLPLPGSPVKGRSPSNSPEPVSGLGEGQIDRGGGGDYSHVAQVNGQGVDPPSPSLDTPTQSNCKCHSSLFKLPFLIFATETTWSTRCRGRQMTIQNN